MRMSEDAHRKRLQGLLAGNLRWSYCDEDVNPRDMIRIKIVSGGQTGFDQGALEAAVRLGYGRCKVCVKHGN